MTFWQRHMSTYAIFINGISACRYLFRPPTSFMDRKSMIHFMRLLPWAPLSIGSVFKTKPVSLGKSIHLTKTSENNVIAVTDATQIWWKSTKHILSIKFLADERNQESQLSQMSPEMVSCLPRGGQFFLQSYLVLK